MPVTFQKVGHVVPDYRPGVVRSAPSRVLSQEYGVVVLFVDRGANGRVKC